MKKKFLLIFNLFWLTLSLFAQDAQYVWAKSIGDANYDLGQSIATDAAGNVFTTGYFIGTVDFDPGAGIANLVSAGTQDVYISKLDASGNYLWAKRMGGTQADLGQSIALDAAGNIYTTGYFRGTADFDPGPLVVNLVSNGTNDVFISKSDASGNFVWAKSVGGLTADEGYSIFPDPYGNVYVTGSFNGTVDFDPGAGNFTLTSAGAQDIFVLKLNASGNFIWAKKMGGSGADLPTFLKLDAAGDIYTTGYFNTTCDFDPGPEVFNLTSTGLTDIFISKLDASGNFVWAKGIGGLVGDAGYSLSFDAAGNVFSTGYFDGTVDFDPGAGVYELTTTGNYDIFILKLDASGNFSWAKKIGGTSSDKGFSLTLDNVGNIYTTGWFSATADFDPGNATYDLTSGGLTDIFISKLNAAGDFVWAKKMGGTGDDVAYAITLDPSKNILTTGKFTGTVDFNPGAVVNNLVSKGLTDIFISKLLQIEPLAANFVASATTVFAGDPIQFTDLSTGGPLTWQWDFNNDGVIDSYQQNPVWTYNETGVYSVKLTVFAGAITNSKTILDYIQVNQQVHSVTNVLASQRTDGSKILDVFYTLDGEEQAYSVSLEISFDNGQNYQVVNNVSGNVRLGTPGQNLHIIWNAGTEFPNGFYYETMKVKVVAVEYDLQCGGVLTDSRDGQQYGTVQIGAQCWMAKNLNIGSMINGTANQTNNGTIEKHCYNSSDANCGIYGGLYQWDEMMNYSPNPGIKGICPDGWRLPTDTDWTTLVTYLGGENAAGGSLKDTGLTYWSPPNGGATNISGFTGLPGGARTNTGSFGALGYFGYFWSSTQIDANQAWNRGLDYGSPIIYRYNTNKLFSNSVRCLKDFAPLNQPPNIPTSPNPENGATNQSNNVDISWTCTDPEGDPLTYDVFFDTQSPPVLVASGASATTYDPGVLAGNTVCYWKIVAHDNQGNTTQGPNWSFTTGNSAWQCGQSFTDSRDGNLYNTVQIGAQCWMSQNLNIGTRIDGLINQSQNGTIEKYCYSNNEANCTTHGGLYQWDEMMNYTTTPGAQGICPTGWHVPTDPEMSTLSTFTGSQPTYQCNSNTNYIGKSLASVSGWNVSANTCAVGNNASLNNATGYSGLSGGKRDFNASFAAFGNQGYFWCSNFKGTTNGYGRGLFFDHPAFLAFSDSKNMGFSVRCLKDEAPAAQLIVTPESQTVSPSSGTALFDVSSNITWIVSENVGWLAVTPTSGNSNGTFTVTYDENLSAELRTGSIIVISADGVLQQTVTIIQSGAQAWSCGQPITDVRDGKTYSTVQIGTLCWMAQNLNIGTRIDGLTNQTQNGTLEKWCYNDNETSCNTYGALYQWDEMMNYLPAEVTQGVCPNGWHLPSEAEWCTMSTYIDATVDCAAFGSSGTDAGGKMKETGTTHWLPPNEGANNSSGFTALPGGYGIDYNIFNNIGNLGYFWSSTQNDGTTAWSRVLISSAVTVFKFNMNKSYGYSVRCIKDN